MEPGVPPATNRRMLRVFTALTLPDDVAETAGLIPNCTLIWYEGMGHMRAASSGRIPRDVLAWTEQLDAAAV